MTSSALPEGVYFRPSKRYHILSGLSTVVRTVDDLLNRLDQPSEEGLVLDDSDIALDAGSIRNAIQKPRQIRITANSLQVVAPE